MKFQRKRLLYSFSILLIVNLLWDAWLYMLPTHDTLWNYIYNILYGCVFFIGGAVSWIYAVKFSLKSNLGKMLLFLGLGLLSFWVGNMIWVYYIFFLGVEIPFPSFADVAYILLYPLMAIGTVYLLRIYQTLLTRKLVINSTIISVISFILIFGFFARPDLSSELSFAQRFINVAYPVGDVITLSIAYIALQIGGGKIHPSLYIFSFGLCMLTIADIVFIYRNAIDVYWNGDIADLLYTLAAFFISVGIFEIINNLSGSTVIPQPTPFSQSVSASTSVSSVQTPMVESTNTI